MNDSDNLSTEVREAEREVDTFYLNNPLLKKTFGEAAWYFLAFCEDILIREFTKPEPTPIQQMAVVADQVVERMKWPLRWMKSACEAGGSAPSKYNADMYQAAWDLFELAGQYYFFEIAFHIWKHRHHTLRA